MTTGQTKLLDEIGALQEKVSTLTYEYWRTYSNGDTWQFWFLGALLIVPLIALFLLLDRQRALQLGFFGFNVHVWFHYIDTYGYTHRLWVYPYKVVPFLPSSVTLDTSLIPVIFMLVYQWSLNHHKNYYVTLTGLSVFLSFLFKPTMVAFGLFQLSKGINYFQLFIFYLLIMITSIGITNLFLHFQQEMKPTSESQEGKRPVKRRFFLSRLLHPKQKAK